MHTPLSFFSDPMRAKIRGLARDCFEIESTLPAGDRLREALFTARRAIGDAEDVLRIEHANRERENNHADQ